MQHDHMTIPEFKKTFEFLTDRLYQLGYDKGWMAVVEELEIRADAEWNMGNGVTADIIRNLANNLRNGNDTD